MVSMNKIVKRVCVLLGGLLTAGCVLKPAQSIYLDYKTKADLMFPLTGESLIGTGGRTKQQNPAHIYARDQVFAIDIVALAPGSPPPHVEKLVERIFSGDLKLFRGDDDKINSNHYCFGRKIVAPGDGIVADAKDGIEDNIPGKRNTRDIPGNYVVIDHLNGEYSMLAHFKKGSVLVKKGDKLSAGQPIGQCGNSGHSTLPHLHYHLQNTPIWLDGEGLPAQFQNYYSNGKFIQRGEPVQGELISHSQPK